jgi:hypothetical protein
MRTALISFTVVLVTLVAAGIAYAQPSSFWAVGNLCVAEDTTLQETRDLCEDAMFASLGVAIPPTTVTHCPTDTGKPNNGKKSQFTPNGWCDITCAENEVEINCAWHKNNSPL